MHGAHKWTRRICPDCGQEVIMYQSAKRCRECAARHVREYQREYAKDLWALKKRIKEEYAE